MTRRGYLDWLRGIAVLIMIEGHTIDSWVLLSERQRAGYSYAILIAGIGAPVFLFLAGTGLVLAADARLRKGATLAAAAAAVRRRGWEIFALAFLFRLQSFIVSGGTVLDLLKVDILNVMGLAMVGAAILWGFSSRAWLRVTLLAAAAVAMAMLTPVVRASSSLTALPDVVESYLRPSPGRTTFTVFPWAGFLFGGAAVGVVLGHVRENRVITALALCGPAMALAGYGASFLPPVYVQTNFWTSSPTFFFLRLGIVLSLIPLAYAWERRPWSHRSRRWEVLQEFGRSSLFVYWIHVEMVYGVLSAAIHRRLTLEQWAAAAALFGVVLFGIVKLKEYLVMRWNAHRGAALSIVPD